MKTLALLSFAFFSTLSYACTDFSGRFKTDAESFYTLTQKNCESIDMADSQSSMTILFNGVEQFMYRTDVLEHGSVVGHQDVFITSSWEDQKWVYDEKKVTTYLDQKVVVGHAKAELSLNADLDLVTVLHHSDGTIETYTDTRAN